MDADIAARLIRLRDMAVKSGDVALVREIDKSYPRLLVESHNGPERAMPPLVEVAVPRGPGRPRKAR